MNKKLDIKTIFIIILSAVLILTILFKKNSVIIDNNADKIGAENKKLIQKNDSLMKANDKLMIHLTVINSRIDSINSELEKNKIKIKNLNGIKNEIPKYISSLSVDDVANALSDAIEKSKN
jgi:hypothetical protein